jgi:hypothetical protein
MIAVTATDAREIPSACGGGEHGRGCQRSPEDPSHDADSRSAVHLGTGVTADGCRYV